MVSRGLSTFGAVAIIIIGQANSFSVSHHEIKKSVGGGIIKPFHGRRRSLGQQQQDDSSTVLNLINNDYIGAPLVDNRYSASDWLYNVLSLPKSAVLREIRNPVITITIWSTLVAVMQKTFSKSSLKILKYLANHMCIHPQAHGLVMSSLGLLLVFRTNSAYQRFNEGRKIWEDILSISRNMSRMVTLYGNEVGMKRKERILNLVASFPYLLRNHIRPGCFCDINDGLDIPDNCSFVLKEPSVEMIETRHEGDKQAVGGTTRPPSYHSAPKRECWVDKRTVPWSLCENEAALNQMAESYNRPLWVCDRMSKEIMEVPYTENFTSRERLSLLGHIEKLTNTIGQCERIHQTAVPLNYARHSLRSLSLWLLTLPFTLVKNLGLLTIPAMAVTSWLLFGVYQIGYSIEDPFQGSLRLSILCDGIKRDVLGGEKNRTGFFKRKEEVNTVHHHNFSPYGNVIEKKEKTKINIEEIRVKTN